MKYLLTFILFTFGFGLRGQSNGAPEAPLSADSLYQQGLDFLAQTPRSAFDQIRAVGKFRKSLQVLDQNNTDNPTLEINNKKQLKELLDYYASLSNSDSLLSETLFYPDSAFQANPRYNQKLKNLLTDLLDAKRRNSRKEFSRIDGLNYRRQGDSDLSLILTFERYWPFEVMEFAAKLDELEKKYQLNSSIKKDDILFANLKNEYDSINYHLKIASLDINIKHVEQQKDAVSAELEESKSNYQKLKNIGFGLIGALLIWAFFFRQRSSKLLKAVNQTLLEEKKRSEELLLNILPAEVAKELKNQASVKAKRHEAVTVLFSDFKNFSQIAKQLSPEALVMELDYCFKEFDRIIDKHRLQKIKTIGDAYMCVGGLHTKGTNHVSRMILAAMEIQRFLNNFKKSRIEKNQHYFEARIGIHTGPVVSGVVGSKKFAFDIWGDTVNVAQQMETNGEPGKVNISGETYELIKSQFECTFRGNITAKNKKEFAMYFVEQDLNPRPLREGIYFKN